MPKVKDKGLGKGRGQGTKTQVTVKKPKAGGKSRKKIKLDKDAVLKESNQNFDKPEPRVRGAKWTKGEILQLFIAANARRKFLKGAFEYHSGGTDSRARAWQEVSDFVNEVSVQHRSIDQCKNKIKDFVGDAKDKLCALRKAMAKTGSPSISDDLQLLPEDSMALDYAGDEAVTGIPGTRPSTLFKNRPKKAVLWSSYRADKIDYYKAFKKPTDSK